MRTPTPKTLACLAGAAKSPTIAWTAAGLVLGSALTAQVAVAQDAAGGAVQLDTVDVTAAPQPRDTPPGTVGYVATRNTTATKTNTPVTEVPQSVSTVTRQQLDDRDVQTVIQAVGYTPGVTAQAFGFDPRFDSFYIRGYDVTYTGIYRDGLRQSGAVFALPRIEPYGLQDLSILRGPASGLYGLGSPGGIVDATTKRPTPAPFGELQLQIGNYDRYQGNFDIGGPVVGNEQFSYRLTGLFRDAGTQFPGGPDNRTYIAPAVTWHPDNDTNVTVSAEHLTSSTVSNATYFNDANHRLTNYYSSDPAFGTLAQEQYRIGYSAEHRFSEFLTLRQNFRFYHVDTDAKYTEIDGIDTDTNTGIRSTGRVRDSLNTVALDNQAEMHFALGPVANTLLTGVGYEHYGLYDKIGFGAAPDLDLTTLNYGAQAIGNPTYSIVRRQSLDEVGVYAQEQAKWNGFILTLNGRESWVNESTDDLVGGTRANQNDAAFTGRAGLAYEFANGITPYVSYATSYSPQLGTTASGAAFRPTTGEQEEAGLKYKIPNADVLLTAAVFDITQNNVLRTDPDNLAFQAATGQVESKGVELEAVASLAPGFNVTAAYTHLDVKITRGDTDTTGNFFSGIPNDSASLFAKYTFQPGWRLAGLGVGAGVRYIGSSFGDDQNTFRNGDVAFVDAVVDYDLAQLDRKFAGLKLQINGSNLADTRHEQCQGGFCYVDERRQVIGSLVYRW